ncbi:MAG: polymer-forming cytoskeletal protein [Bradymonadaceae bacterium]|nr:polymer-forming cytoskeletal protein [Lujinxingiaceae bacterium]
MADTVIGRNTVIDGEITGNQPVVIEGSVKGRIALDSLVTIAAEGRVEADVHTPQVQINGQLTGNVVAAERVEITAEGRMVGDIRSPRILIADGAGFKGHIDMDVE